MASSPSKAFGPLRLYLPDISTLDPVALTLTAAALIALLRFQVPMLALIAASATMDVALPFVHP